MNNARWSAVLLAILVGCAGLRCAGPPPPPAAVPPQFVRSEISLGQLSSSAPPIPVTFIIRNDTNVARPIASTTVSCRCTFLQNAPAAIPAHGEGRFDLIFHPDRDSGPVLVFLTVEFADGSTLVGKLHALVTPPPGA